MQTIRAEMKALSHDDREVLLDCAHSYIETLGRSGVTATASPDGIVLDDGMSRMGGLNSTRSIRIALESWPS